MYTIGIICAGPSNERGISLNSARTLQDHLDTEQTQTKIYFVDQDLNFFLINSSNLYSNTPSDFDFKIKDIAQPISQEELSKELQSCDILFPVIHGPFGEDGTLQARLEEANVPFVGSQSQACINAYLKDNAQDQLKKNGFPTIGHLNIDKDTTEEQIQEFWKTHCPNDAIIKPTNSGSSIDVIKLSSIEELRDQKKQLLKNHNSLQLQPFCTLTEITMIVITNKSQQPVALLPTETRLQITKTGIFDYRSKYLPTNACRHHTPARINDADLLKVRKQAEDIFKQFNLKDFARLDGWVCPEKGFICCDINIISGFEENSFLFKQASTCGMNHQETITKILESASHRQNTSLPSVNKKQESYKKPIFVIFGGASSERQVSLMSGRNIWFKLENSKQFKPIPFFMDKEHRVWQLPYGLFLHHTVEEISDDIETYTEKSVAVQEVIADIQQALNISALPINKPKSMDIQTWIQLAKQQNASVLLGLHGGIGENGTLQKELSKHNIPFNGSEQYSAELCMDKNQTIQAIQALSHPDILSQKQHVLTIKDLEHIHTSSHTEAAKIWQETINDSSSDNTMIIKPLSDGCSSGIVCLRNEADLKTYAAMIISNKKQADAHTFYNQPTPIELPTHSHAFLIEDYIQTDTIKVNSAELEYQQELGWHELTIVVREKKGTYQAYNPSITVKEHAVLSVEEKFQGGTGINLTPPPEKIISKNQCDHIKSLSCSIAKQLNIKQYARLDIFYNTIKSKIQLIEANTLPALTPSTVLFQQALAETPPIHPREFLETLILERIEKRETETVT
ncbi:MAG: hypothetical protein VX737_00590 [Pseudomonadota bacterium]|nr:hypothetical protein [Pseudomonadota bacterium]